MTALPPSTNLTGGTVTQGQFKTAITALRDYLSGLLGSTGVVADARAALGLAAVASSGAYSDVSGTPAALPPNGAAGGDLTGTYPNPTLAASGVTAGTYASANVTVDAKGRVTSAAAGTGSGTRSLAANGYYKEPGGFTIQWGSVSMTAPSQTTVTFPVAFSSAVYSIAAQIANVPNAGALPIGSVGVGSQTTTNFVLSDQFAGTWTFNWIAIGS